MGITCRILLLFLVLLGNAPVTGEDVRLRPSFAQSGGVYAVGAGEGVFGKLNTFRAHPDQDINERLRAGRESGLVNVVQLSHGHRWNEDRDAGATKLEAWLQRTELSLVDVLHLAEEQPYNAAAWLDPLYDLIKAHDPSLPVYVWPTYPLGPMGEADGYVYDAYGEGYMDSRQRFMDFLRTGKPLIMCVDASGFSDYRLAREQLMACHERDIPVFYFAADNGSGSYNNWYGKPTRALAHCRNFMFSAMAFQRRCHGSEPMAAADFIWGDSIELAPDASGMVDYAWSEFGPATLYGFTRLEIAGTTVRNGGPGEVVMDYQFWSLLPIENGRLMLDGGSTPGEADGVAVSVSRCGKSDDWRSVNASETAGGWSYELGDTGREFRIRVILPEGAVFRGGRLRGKCSLPADKAIDLDLYYDGWRKKILYTQELDTGLWRAMATIDEPALLNEGKPLALHGKKGRGIRVNVVEAFRSDTPLEKIRVQLTGMSHAALGGSFSLGLSLNGETVLAEGVAMSKPRDDGKYEGAYAVDTSEIAAFQGVQTFYVHLVQANNSGLLTNISSQLKSLEIEATRADTPQ